LPITNMPGRSEEKKSGKASRQEKTSQSQVSKPSKENGKNIKRTWLHGAENYMGGGGSLEKDVSREDAPTWEEGSNRILLSPERGRKRRRGGGNWGLR